ncbi:DeoR/GlpR family DNA-binding transcription regulator [Amaricoccus sp.]|uniref:DeoR/GlpR family DNA-binding transcription regulator n=1 Tax=Amaricoccus sp. TaxID=1872485 RepID=UPI001B6ADDC5|nr:DeoR/GlpR family DNA-binding transcription regulator [Amaricoccus sp.]MBP7242472.1 DeoR/GlpR transcriptional regulator [Amaricoccus sp.]
MATSRWQNEILDAVRGQGRATIAALAASLNVSGETIRRHVRPLVDEGLLVRAHGAVALSEREPPFQRRMGVRAAAKRAIALAVGARVPDGASVMLDTGSTTVFVAEALAARRELTVVTNSIEIARAMVGRGDHRIYLAGGELRPDLGAMVGPEALGFVAQFRADLAILSAGALDPGHGVADFHLDEARVARAMLERADRLMVAADRSKFDLRAAVPVCPLDEIDVFVTDVPPPDAAAAALAAAAVEVVTAVVAEPAFSLQMK